MHEVRSHLKGKADWVVSGNSILHSFLIILQQQDSFTVTDQQRWDVQCVFGFLSCRAHHGHARLLIHLQDLTYSCYVNHILHKSSRQLWLVFTFILLNEKKQMNY